MGMLRSSLDLPGWPGRFSGTPVPTLFKFNKLASVTLKNISAKIFNIVTRHFQTVNITL